MKVSSMDDIRLSDLAKDVYSSSSTNKINTILNLTDQLRRQNQPSSHASSKAIFKNKLSKNASETVYPKPRSDKSWWFITDNLKKTTMNNSMASMRKSMRNWFLNKSFTTKYQKIPAWNAPRGNNNSEHSLDKTKLDFWSKQISESENIISVIAKFLIKEYNHTNNINYNLLFESSYNREHSSNNIFNQIMPDWTNNLPKPKHPTSQGTYQWLYQLWEMFWNDPKVELSSFVSAALVEELTSKFHFHTEILNPTSSEFTKDIEGYCSKEVLDEIKDMIVNMNNKMNWTERNRTKDKELDKKIIIWNWIYFQLLSEISLENKHRANWIHKVTSLQFITQIQSLIRVVDMYKMKWKIQKNWTQSLLKDKYWFIRDEKQKNSQSKTWMEEISEALWNNKVTVDNWTRHKDVIHKLWGELKVQKEKNLAWTSENNIITSELEFWVHDFNNWKLDNYVRDKMKALNKSKIVEPLEKELSAQGVSRSQISWFINSEIYLTISEQRTFLASQIDFYRTEIKRLKTIAEENYNKKLYFKRAWNDTQDEFNKYKITKEKEFRDFFNYTNRIRAEVGTETTVDFFKYNKICKNNDLVVSFNKLNHNKMEDILESIKFKSVRVFPISKDSLMSLLPEILNEHSTFVPAESTGPNLVIDCQFDDYFINYMRKKFKIRKTAKKHTIEVVMSVLQHAHEDKRIELFRRFLYNGPNALKNEVTNIVLVVLNNLPISLYKFYSNEVDIDKYLISGDSPFEIYHNKLRHLNLVAQNKNMLLNAMKVIDDSKNNKQVITWPSEQKKSDLFFWTRFYNKSVVFISDWKYNMKNKGAQTELLKKFVERFIIENKEFGFTTKEGMEVFKRSFDIKKEEEELIVLDSFFKEMKNRYSFKISLFDALDITINRLVFLFNQVNERAVYAFQECDQDENKYLDIKEFEIALTKLMDKPPQRGQIADLYAKANKNNDKEFWTKEEFMYFVSNYPDIYVPIFDKYWIK